MNVKLLRKVAKHISKEPKRLNMNIIAIKNPVMLPEDLMPPCGTVGCIAGWACVLSGIDEIEADFSNAAELLQIGKEEMDRLGAEPKFAIEQYGNYLAWWPKRFALRYIKAKTPKGRAAATVARIEHFIKTKGKQ